MRKLKAALSAGAALTALAATGVLGTNTPGSAAAELKTAAKASAGACQLGNGIQHVIEITFDNVHFNRDNPNVLSDLEQMPALNNFITHNGTLLSNNHTPLIAHTADDSLTNYTGLYGDRHGQGITNSYETYLSTGSVVKKSSFAYWTDTYGVDTYPNQPYSPTVPAAGQPPITPPAPWVPFTRAGCNFGAVSTANMVLENTKPDIAKVFGTTSPEAAQLAADTDPFKDQETNDYVGLAVHCAHADSFCADAKAIKYGQTTASNTAAQDLLPNEPNAYNNYQALFGHRYLQPQLAQAATSGGVRKVHGRTYPVTDSSGNLVDLNGQTLTGQYANTPGFPGFGPITAAQSLAYVADMQETGVPVTYAYISDLHAVKSFDGGPCSPASSTQQGQPAVDNPLGPGDPCYYENSAVYNRAFAQFFQRLADDGIDQSNTLFVFTSDEGDHFAGANVGRAVAPACTGKPGTAGYTCTYQNGQLGEQSLSIHGLLSAQENQNTAFYSEPQGAALFVTGQPGPNDPNARQLARDIGTATANDAYDGNVTENVANYLADPTVEQLLHFTNADPSRTPTLTLFPKPDFYLTSGTKDFPACATGTTASNAAVNCSSTNGGFAWNHGYYAPEVNNTWLGLVGPGVAMRGIDGSSAADGPNSSGSANLIARTDTQVNNSGTWTDHTDIQPTIMALTGLNDDYTPDGRVLVEDLTVHPGQTANPQYHWLATCYKQLNSSVGIFGTNVLRADTAALKSGSSTDDSTYQQASAKIASLGAQRDALAQTIKTDLYNAAFNNSPLTNAWSELSTCGQILEQSFQLQQDNS